MLGYLSLDIVFLKAQSFPGATLSKNCPLLGTDNVRRQISEYFLRLKWRLLGSLSNDDDDDDAQ